MIDAESVREEWEMNLYDDELRPDEKVLSRWNQGFEEEVNDEMKEFEVGKLVSLIYVVVIVRRLEL